MDKQDFLTKLNRQLKCLKKAERKKYIEYYEEIISDIVENGESEEEAIARQGNPEQIAREILSNSNPEYQKNRDWRGITLLISSVILLLASMVSTFILWGFKNSVRASISIIGGADGPTSIFLAGTFGTPWGIYIGTVVVVVVTIIYFIRKHKK